jgi:hypothetical protein
MPAALLLLSLLPALLFWTWCTPQHGCLALVHFGENFAARALPEVREIAPPTLSPWGYDGQFYAQVALDPTLRNPSLEQALDNPPYRARRIGLPAFAALLGMGNPLVTLHIFSILNLLFWLMLAVLLLKRYPPDQLRHWLVCLAILWGAGTLHSMERSLTDLPAASLGLLAVFVGQRGGRWVMAASALVKETSVLSFIAASGWQPAANPRIWLRSIMTMTLMILPLLLWIGWVHWRFGEVSTGQARNFSWPAVAVWAKLGETWTHLSNLTQLDLPNASYRVLELLAPLSLLVQSLYLLLRPAPRAAIWLYGIGFAVLFWVIGSPIWAEQQAYTRTLLPLTFAFNLLLLERKQARFAWWFVLGNIGLCGMALKIPYHALTKLAENF